MLGVALLVLLVCAAVRAGAWSGRLRDEKSPEAILKRHYARGELGEQEYERRPDNLRKVARS